MKWRFAGWGERLLRRSPTGRHFCLQTAGIWYAVMMIDYGWRLHARDWANAFAMSGLVGTLLTINAIPAGHRLRDLTARQIWRFYLIPFCVSSFSTAAKATGFTFIFAPDLAVNLHAAILAAAWAVIFLVRRSHAHLSP